MFIRRGLRASVGTLVAVGAVLAVVVSAISPPAWAEVTAKEISFSSEVTLLERNEYGAYSRYIVRLRIESGEARLWADKDGDRVTVPVPLEECQALWWRLLDAGLETMSDPPDRVRFPDQSSFVVQFRVAGREGGFQAYGVDNLADPRYREIVTSILALGDFHLRRSREAREP